MQAWAAWARAGGPLRTVGARQRQGGARLGQAAGGDDDALDARSPGAGQDGVQVGGVVGAALVVLPLELRI
jgi:hypothetical protein